MAELTTQEELFLRASKKDGTEIVNSIVDGKFTKMTAESFIRLCVDDPEFNVNVTKGDGNTALHSVAANKKDDLVNILLTSDAIKTDLKNQRGYTAAQLAQKAGAKDIKAKIDAREVVLKDSPAHKKALKHILAAKAQRIKDEQTSANEQRASDAALKATIAANRNARNGR